MTATVLEPDVRADELTEQQADVRQPEVCEMGTWCPVHCTEHRCRREATAEVVVACPPCESDARVVVCNLHGEAISLLPQLIKCSECRQPVTIVMVLPLGGSA